VLGVKAILNNHDGESGGYRGVIFLGGLSSFVNFGDGLRQSSISVMGSLGRTFLVL